MRGNSCINIETLIHLLNALQHELGVEFCEIRLGDDFLVRPDGDVEPRVEGGVFVSPREYGGEITAGNTKPHPFKMVKTDGKKIVSE